MKLNTKLVLALGALAACGGGANAQCEDWQRATVAGGPAFRSSYGLTFDTQRQRAVLFGGHGVKASGTEYLGDTWEWDGSRWILRASSGPDARQNPGMVYDSARGRTVLFGGLRNDTGPVYHGITWEWDGNTWAQRSTSSGPSARYLHAMAFDAARARTVLFGGLNASDFRDTTTWTWNGTTWTAAANSGPAIRYGHSMAYDPVRQRVVLFGGYGGDGNTKQLLNDTWEWNGSAWTRTAVTGPSARFYHAMAFDAARGRVVVFGGRAASGAALDDMWEWTGTAWTQVPSGAPADRESITAAFDTSRARLLTFGGFSPRGRYGDTWVRATGNVAPVITSQPLDTRAAPGGVAILSVAVASGGDFFYQWKKEGTPITPELRVVGSQTDTLYIFDAIDSDSGLYTVDITSSCGNVTSRQARVEVRCPADTDNGSMTGTADGAVDILDVLAFVEFFENGSSLADIDDGTSSGTVDNAVDVNDLLYFILRFELGC